MEEQRKHAILYAATLLCARKLMETSQSLGLLFSQNLKLKTYHL